jgi:hypothetical protein
MEGSRPMKRHQMEVLLSTEYELSMHMKALASIRGGTEVEKEGLQVLLQLLNAATVVCNNLGNPSRIVRPRIAKVA